jgi:hypothetical protein
MSPSPRHTALRVGTLAAGYQPLRLRVRVQADRTTWAKVAESGLLGAPLPPIHLSRMSPPSAGAPLLGPPPGRPAILHRRDVRTRSRNLLRGDTMPPGPRLPGG